MYDILSNMYYARMWNQPNSSYSYRNLVVDLNITSHFPFPIPQPTPLTQGKSL